jgi:hypothetical protein
MHINPGRFGCVMAYVGVVKFRNPLLILYVAQVISPNDDTLPVSCVPIGQIVEKSLLIGVVHECLRHVHPFVAWGSVYRRWDPLDDQLVATQTKSAAWFGSIQLIFLSSKQFEYPSIVFPLA